MICSLMVLFLMHLVGLGLVKIFWYLSLVDYYLITSVFLA